MLKLLSFVLVLSAPPHVVDGDTVRQGDVTYRLENIDAPETGARAACDREARLGRQATARARALVAEAGRIEVAGPGRRDRYGRLIARVAIDGDDLGERLVEEGLAQPWRGRKAQWCG